MASGANIDGFPFAKVISLGAHCAVRYQIDRYFGRAGSGPFEWTVSPLQSVIDAIAYRFESIAQRVVTISDGHSTIDHRYRICYHHEFKRDEDGKAIIDVPALQNIRAKMEHKCRSFEANLETGPVLFVRYGSEKSNGIANVSQTDEPILYSRLNELVTTIDRTYSGLNFRLAYVHHANLWGEPIKDADLDKRIDVFTFNWVAKTEWSGNQDKWDLLFSRYRLDGKYTASPDLRMESVHRSTDVEVVALANAHNPEHKKTFVFYTEKMRAALNEASFLQDKVNGLIIQQQDGLADIILGSVNESRRVIGMIKYEIDRLKAEAAKSNGG